MLYLVFYSILALLSGLIVFYLYKYHRDKISQPKLFANNTWFVLVNSILFAVAWYANFNLDQLFCLPVTWVNVVLFVFMATFLTMPFIIKPTVLKYLQAVVLGSGVFILLYIIVFASEEYWIMMIAYVFFAIPFDIAVRYIRKKYNTRVLDAAYILGAIIITPYFLLFQLAKYYHAMPTQRLKRVFIISPVVVLVIGVSLSFRINYLAEKFTVEKKNPPAIVALIDNPMDNYLGELILGAHWKYHTELCMYDGSRPPLHDPVLGFAHMLNMNISVGDFSDNLALYKKIFPGIEYNLKCKCSAQTPDVDYQ